MGWSLSITGEGRIDMRQTPIRLPETRQCLPTSTGRDASASVSQQLVLQIQQPYRICRDSVSVEDRREFISQFCGSGIADLRVFGKRAVNNKVQLGEIPRMGGGGSFKCFIKMPNDEFGIKRNHACQHFVQHHTKRVDIGLGVTLSPRACSGLLISRRAGVIAC